MPCSILFKNTPNAWPTGSAIGVFDGDHQFGACEQKSKFILKYPEKEWSRAFVIVHILDKDKEYYNYLKENVDRYYVSPQGPESPYYNQLLEHAEITTTSEILDSLIQDRGT